MATQIFLGNPSQSVIDWIKGHPPHPPQQQFATIVNNTHLPTAEWPEINADWSLQNIALSGSSISYKIQPGQTKNIKPGTYRTIVTNKWYYDSQGDHYDDGAYNVHIYVNDADGGNLNNNGIHLVDYDHGGIPDFTLNYDDGTSEHFENTSYTFEGEYTYDVNVNYEFTYGQKNL